MPPDSLSFSERLQASFTQIGDYVPRFLGALVLLFVGYLLARLVERGVDRVLRRIRFNRLLEGGGVMDAVERSGSHLNPTRVVANLFFWTAMFAVLIIVANAAGFGSVANVFSELVGYVPSVVVALVIVLVGLVLGGFVGGLISLSMGKLAGGPTLARVGRWGVIVLAIFMALQELGVATEIVTTAFAILFGALALGLALAFGLGSRDLAGEIMRQWYDRYRAERDAIVREAAEHERAEEDRAERRTSAGNGVPVVAASRAPATGELESVEQIDGGR